MVSPFISYVHQFRCRGISCTPPVINGTAEERCTQSKRRERRIQQHREKRRKCRAKRIRQCKETLIQRNKATPVQQWSTPTGCCRQRCWAWPGHRTQPSGQQRSRGGGNIIKIRSHSLDKFSNPVFLTSFIILFEELFLDWLTIQWMMVGLSNPRSFIQ